MLKDSSITWLVKQFGKDNVEPEASIAEGRGKIDLLVFGKYGIEIKMADNVGELDRLPGQIERYRLYGYHMGVIIIKPEDWTPRSLNDTLELLERLDIPFRVIEKKIKRVQKTKKFILKPEKTKKRGKKRGRKK
mgnify:CR=1 FL=1